MFFKNLEEKCLFYRGLTDYKLLPNAPLIIMCDGKNFSKKVKNKMAKPFDKDFIRIMNDTAKYVCGNIMNCKAAYVQSDEISFLVTDYDTPTTDSFFGNRLCKIQSIVASMVTSYFNKEMILHNFCKGHDSAANYDPYAEGDPTYTIYHVCENIKNMPLYEFDCKAWTVPNINDAFAWFLFRQIDCIRNSKQQAAQSWCSHKELMGKDTDSQIAFLKEKAGVDWNNFDDGEKFGRFITREINHFKMTNPLGQEVEYDRSSWVINSGWPLTTEEGKNKFLAKF